MRMKYRGVFECTIDVVADTPEQANTAMIGQLKRKMDTGEVEFALWPTARVDDNCEGE